VVGVAVGEGVGVEVAVGVGVEVEVGVKVRVGARGWASGRVRSAREWLSGG